MRSMGLAVLGFLLLQSAAVHWLAGSERPPAMPDLSKFPTVINNWTRSHEDPIGDDVKKELNADQLISRGYMNAEKTVDAGLFVAWFQSQSSGLKQPHSPQVCLPGSGWVPEVTDDVALNTSLGAIRVNRYIVVNGGSRAVVLYWYQTPRRVIESEWAAKFWLIPDSVRDRRTDTSLVRIVTWATKPGSEGTQLATNAARTFGEQVYPVLREWLPR